MCGIAGIFGGIVSENEMEQMALALKHRGPDASGFYKTENTGLAHTRLSILELSPAGDQPMMSADGNFILIYNGEIYNHLDLRYQYLPEIRFKGHSDTETLLHLLIKYGTEKLSELNGMFAFAFYDQNCGKLLLARDPVGIKPLYHTQDNTGRTIFASEIKALLKAEGVQAVLNYDKLAEFFTFHFLAGEETLFKNIYEVKPGTVHQYTIKNTVPQIVQYSSLIPVDKSTASIEENIERLEELLSKAIKRQCLSDVEIGLMLSGGLDSATVATFMDSPAGKKAYCFADPNQLHPETEKAKQIAKKNNFIFREVKISAREIGSLLQQCTYFNDEPVARPHSLAAYAIAKAANEDGIKVLMTGEGGDEIFAGYQRYLTGFPDEHHHLVYANNLAAKQRNDLLFKSDYVFPGREKIATGLKQHDFINRQLFYDQQTFLQHFLQRSDRMGMASSVENRVPLLDLELLKFVNSIPGEQKIKNNQLKYLQRRVLSKYFSESFIDQPKLPFDFPVENYFKKESRDWVMNSLQSKNLSSLFDKKGIRQLKDQFEAGRENVWKTIWLLLSLDTWISTYKVSLN